MAHLATLNRKYGWKKQKPDARDFKLSIPTSTRLPIRYHLYAGMPPVYDQGQLGSCTANAWSAAFEYQQNQQKLGPFMPSRLFLYYNERDLENDVAQDGGAEVRDGAKALNQFGTLPESYWPYNITAFAKRPSPACFARALANKITEYQAVNQTAADIKTAIHNHLPVVFGMNVYESFESDQVANTGVVPMPNVNTEQLLGGHCMLITGYDDHYKAFWVRNSWGESWGAASHVNPNERGYCSIPYDYLLNPDLASDFWVINQEQ